MDRSSPESIQIVMSVTNVLSHSLTQRETSVLAKDNSYNVSMTPRQLKLVAAVTEVIQSMRGKTREKIVKKISILSKLPLQMKNNLTTEESQALW